MIIEHVLTHSNHFQQPTEYFTQRNTGNETALQIAQAYGNFEVANIYQRQNLNNSFEALPREISQLASSPSRPQKVLKTQESQKQLTQSMVKMPELMQTKSMKSMKGAAIVTKIVEDEAHAEFDWDH